MDKFTAEKLKELNNELEDMILKSTNLKELGNYIRLKWYVNIIIDNEVIENDKKEISKMINGLFTGAIK